MAGNEDEIVLMTHTQLDHAAAETLDCLAAHLIGYEALGRRAMCLAAQLRARKQPGRPAKPVAKKAIAAALKKAGGRKVMAAKLLGISERHLRNLIVRHKNES